MPQDVTSHGRSERRHDTGGTGGARAYCMIRASQATGSPAPAALAEVRLDPTSPSDADSAGPTGESGQVLLGRFRIEKRLGRGGMGEVFLARDRLLNRRVAIKRLS